jgi:A/G-specific adenine glycosylase
MMRDVSDPAVAAVLAWWDAQQRELPWRAHRDMYAIWVSEVMSAQTSVTRAAAAWERWMARWPTVEALAAAALPEVLGEWQGLGYPRRARDLHRAARAVAERGWPAELTELPGIGPYVASAIRCFALEQPVLPLDVNVRRVLARRFPDGLDPSGDPWRAGQALMEFGQRICAARPRCDACPVRAGCPAHAAGGRGGVDPAPRARRQARFAGSLRQRRGALLRRVLTEGEVALDELGPDEAGAAAGLVADGLARASGGRLYAPD